jgi:hypothetical protein
MFPVNVVHEKKRCLMTPQCLPASYFGGLARRVPWWGYAPLTLAGLPAMLGGGSRRFFRPVSGINNTAELGGSQKNCFDF